MLYFTAYFIMILSFFLFFCKLSNHLSINHLSIDWLIDWLRCETWILWWSPELWDLFCTSFDRVFVCTRLELYYDFMYRFIILCLSYLATWLPFLNKPIVLIDSRFTWMICLELQLSGYGAYLGCLFVGSIFYADDVCLISHTCFDLQKMLDMLWLWSDMLYVCFSHFSVYTCFYNVLH